MACEFLPYGRMIVELLCFLHYCDEEKCCELKSYVYCLLVKFICVGFNLLIKFSKMLCFYAPDE